MSQKPQELPLPRLYNTGVPASWPGHHGSPSPLGHGKDPMASTIFPSIETALHSKSNREWMEKTIEASHTTIRQHSESHKVRVTSSIVKEVVQNNDTHHFGKVNMGFRTKLGQTNELIRKLEMCIKDNNTETANLKKAKAELAGSRGELDAPLALVKRRLKIREQRPNRENIEDPVHQSLETEMNTLTSMAEQGSDKLQAASHMLERLHTMREKLKADLKDKKHALDLDGQCLTLTHEAAPQHPPKEETIHTKTTTLAGEVPPASPTSVLMGENAAGRFAYEWLFTKEERDALKLCFQNMANDSGEIYAASFQKVYQDANIMVSAEEYPAVLEMMQLHPDATLTWPKYCEVLAMMRGQREHPVNLPPVWRSKTKSLLENNHALIQASARLRFQCHEMHGHADEVRRKTHLIVQKFLRKKVQEATDMRNLCEKRIMEAELEIKRLEQSEKALIAAFEAKAKPLTVAEARYNIRRQRREREEVHDEVEDLMAKEVEELQKGVAAIQRELDSTRATLSEVKDNKKMLEADYEDKALALELDQKCLKLDDKARDKRSPYNAFLKGHI